MGNGSLLRMPPTGFEQRVDCGVAGMEVERWVGDNCVYQRPWHFVYGRGSADGKKEEDLGVERTCSQLGHGINMHLDAPCAFLIASLNFLPSL